MVHCTFVSIRKPNAACTFGLRPLPFTFSAPELRGQLDALPFLRLQHAPCCRLFHPHTHRPLRAHAFLSAVLPLELACLRCPGTAVLAPLLLRLSTHVLLCSGPSCLSWHGCASALEDSRWRRHFHFVHHSLKSMAWQVFRRGMNRVGRSRSNINPQSYQW